AETIREILKLDSQILCAVVTAYTDRSPEQIGMAFRRQDDWLYFNKPFSTGEVRQTAYHLMTAWNQRRREELLVSNLEMMQSGLMCILESVSDVNRIPPLVLDSLLEGILKHFLRLLDAKDGFVVLRTDNPEFVRLGSGIFEDRSDDSTSAIKEKWPMVEEVMNNRVSSVRGNVAATPLIIGEELLGVLFVQKEKEIVQDPKLLDMYAVQAVNLIQHSKLYEELDRRNLELNKKNQELLDLLGRLTQSEKLRTQFEKLSYIDALTGIPNRRYLEIRINEELSRSKRHGFSMACLMMDIDHFKSINDTYGHAAGDQVLKELGELLRNRKRAYDVVGRYGGEEFAMLFKQIDQADTFTVADRVRAAIEHHEFVFEGRPIKVTVSMGIAAVKPSSNDTIISILQKADEALYAAKQGGRNRCVLL
ncbi:MAG: sensor domain-containing diguanylate cyclase, partial [Pseudomonadota bacterium]